MCIRDRSSVFKVNVLSSDEKNVVTLTEITGALYISSIKVIKPKAGAAVCPGVVCRRYIALLEPLFTVIDAIKANVTRRN